MTSTTRAAFLTAGAAVLAGCAKTSGAGILPGLSPSAVKRAPSTTPAPPIPQSVLRSPIVGEARRFDGASVPAGWIKLDGQRLRASQYRELVSIIGNGGSRDAATFVLPTPHAGWIIAVAGTFPSSPRVLEALHRGAGMKLGVSVDGADVHEAEPRRAPPRPAPAPVDPWFPGTAPTQVQIDAAQRTNTETSFRSAAQHRGAPVSP